MKALIESYEEYLVGEHKVSPNSAKFYRRDAELFFSKMNIETVSQCEGVRAVDVQNYINAMTEGGKAEATVLRNAASLRSFYGFLLERGLVKENPALELELPRPKHKIPVVLSPGEINRLLSMPKSDDEKGIRDKAMLELLYATGMKVTELISLEIKDVDLSGGMVNCRSEEKRRAIPIGASAEDALRNYIENVREFMIKDKNEKVLFVNCSGSAMTRQGFWKLIKKYIDEAGIKKAVTPQTLRHSFAVHLLQNGADADSVSRMLGYNDPSSTRVYSDMVRENIKRVYNRSHPRA